MAKMDNICMGGAGQLLAGRPHFRAPISGKHLLEQRGNFPKENLNFRASCRSPKGGQQASRVPPNGRLFGLLHAQSSLSQSLASGPRRRAHPLRQSSILEEVESMGRNEGRRGSRKWDSASRVRPSGQSEASATSSSSLPAGWLACPRLGPSFSSGAVYECVRGCTTGSPLCRLSASSTLAVDCPRARLALLGCQPVSRRKATRGHTHRPSSRGRAPPAGQTPPAGRTSGTVSTGEPLTRALAASAAALSCGIIILLGGWSSNGEQSAPAATTARRHTEANNHSEPQQFARRI